ncbi:protein phosphatase 1 regulatory subunit 36 isoform X2 [Trachemys scripta elegans]|uniref:protein phosphatase 1 regulatory subunit 36 isoform X2 n=2 Tax=Trachemys scripta elegans TaxID=31138 RepID=UPI00155751D0|nr:protein phosphatase 1 regulatory subunit 36 isoform X2 [Trachemys scripta elegans]
MELIVSRGCYRDTTGNNASRSRIVLSAAGGLPSTMQPMTKIAPGVWYWKEDTKTLEFARSTPSMFRDLFGARFPEKRMNIQEEKSPRLSKRGQNACVTLDDVKYAALFLVQEDESYHISSFTAVMRSKQLDEFLMALLFYLSYYLEKIALEKKPKSFMVNPSVLDQKEREETLAKLTGTKKHLAKVYCILILGLGMAEQHHMACGKRKTSSSQKDREFFECFYNFCTYVAWVVFRRKHFQEIQEEVGRLLRSDIFNPALREKNSPNLQKTDVSADQRKVIFPYHRSVYARRPAIKSVVGQRSPVLSTLLPLPKDNAQYLFQTHYLHRGRTLPTCSSKDLPDYSTVELTPKVGIIGALRSKFNPHTLMPIGVIEEEEEKKEEEQRTKRNSFLASSYDLALSSHRGTQVGISRPSMVLSRATTEGDYSENG